MSRNTFALLSIALIVASGLVSTSKAGLFWAGGGSAATAGGGNWDNSTLDWSGSSGGTASTAWTSNNDAIFQGTAGGAVTINANINVGSATFNSGAGVFTLSNTFDVEVNGAGFANNAASQQNITNNGTLNFNLASSASGGSTPIKYSGNGFLTFSGTSSAGSAIITNNGVLTFAGKSVGGTASIVNASTMEISGLTLAGLTIGSLDNSGSVDMGTGTGGTGRTLTLTTLTLENDAEFDFTLGTTAALITAGNVAGHPAAGHSIAIDIEAGAGFGASTYVLIHDTGGTLSLADFSAGTVPAGYTLQLANGNHDLDFVAVVPEPSAYASLLGGLGLVAWLRRRVAA